MKTGIPPCALSVNVAVPPSTNSTARKTICHKNCDFSDATYSPFPKYFSSFESNFPPVMPKVINCIINRAGDNALDHIWAQHNDSKGSLLKHDIKGCMMWYLAKSRYRDCWSSCEQALTLNLMSKLITNVISAPLFHKCNFIYKYPPPCTQESPPPTTSKDINLEEMQLPHFDCYTGKALLLCNTTLFQNISTSEPQLQQPQRQKWQFILHGTSSQKTAAGSR